jgi:hypothetical protein
MSVGRAYASSILFSTILGILLGEWKGMAVGLKLCWELGIACTARILSYHGMECYLKGDKILSLSTFGMLQFSSKQRRYNPVSGTKCSGGS